MVKKNATSMSNFFLTFYKQRLKFFFLFLLDLFVKRHTYTITHLYHKGTNTTQHPSEDTHNLNKQQLSLTESETKHFSFRIVRSLCAEKICSTPKLYHSISSNSTSLHLSLSTLLRPTSR